MADKLDRYECDNQLTLFDCDTSCMDIYEDRDGRKRKPPEWMEYKRCENCTRYLRSDEQPPAGWGVVGWCNEHKQKVASTSYCMSFEDKRRML